jgi:hypothetical protein
MNRTERKIPANDVESDEEILKVAFDVDEDFNLPEEYELDEINQKSVEFLKYVKMESKNLELKNANSKSIGIEYSLNVNNNLIFQDVYDKLGIDNEWIKEIKKEFSQLQNEVSKYKKEKNMMNTSFYKNVGDLIKDYNLYYENIKHFSIPDEKILQELGAKLTNKICIKLINHFNKVFSQTSQNVDKFLMWLYYILAMLETPLVDEDNSVLYSLNKKIVKNLTEAKEETITNEAIGKRIIFIIISEIFGQKVMINK